MLEPWFITHVLDKNQKATSLTFTLSFLFLFVQTRNNLISTCTFGTLFQLPFVASNQWTALKLLLQLTFLVYLLDSFQ